MAHVSVPLGSDPTGYVQLFGTSNGETTYVPLAQYVGSLLDTSVVAGGPNLFGSFVLPQGADLTWKADIDSFVQYRRAVQREVIDGDGSPTLTRDVSINSGTSVYHFHLNTSVPGPPVQGSVSWFGEVIGPNGVVLDGISVQSDTSDPTKVTVTVDNSVVGTVVLYANYDSATTEEAVLATPIVVVSRPPGTTVTAITIRPSQAMLAINDQIKPEVWAQYDNAVSSQVYLSAGTAQFTSSNSAVMTVLPGNILRALAPGSDTITAVYGGFTAQATLTVMPQLYFVETNANPAVAGSVTSGRFYSDGTLATVTATPNAGYTFVNWTENGTVVGNSSSYSLVANQDQTLVANFWPLSISAWKASYFTSAELQDATISGNLASPAGDGISNLVKYALVMPARVSSVSSLPTIQKTANTLSITYTKNSYATDVTFHPEWSTDFVTWSSTGITEQILSSSSTTTLVKDSIATGSQQRLFMRLKVTTP